MMRIILFVLVLLSAFTTAKSFVAVENIDRYTDELRYWIMNDMLTTKDQRTPWANYEAKLDAIQKQWAVLRYVSIASLALSAYGIVLASRRKKPDSR